MEISIITICFLRMVLLSDAFFLNPRDITRMFRFFGPDPIPHRLGHYHPHYHRRHGNQEIHRNDRNNRYYPKENVENDRYGYQNIKEYGDKLNDKTPNRYQSNGFYINHENCHHADHQSYDFNRRTHKIPEDRYGKPPKNKRYEYTEDDDDYYDSSNKQNKKRRHQKIKNQTLPKKTKYQDDDDEENREEDVNEEYYDSSAKPKKYKYNEKKGTTDYSDKNKKDKPLYYKKDYVTGVLVMLPKIQNEDDSPHHSKVARPQNLFFQNILKTEDDQHHLNEGEIIRSFILN